MSALGIIVLVLLCFSYPTVMGVIVPGVVSAAIIILLLTPSTGFWGAVLFVLATPIVAVFFCHVTGLQAWWDRYEKERQALYEQYRAEQKNP